MRDYLLLYLNGRRHEIRCAAVFQPLSEWLRSARRLTGTKVVCAEGDCGSCSVLIGRPRAGRIDYRPVTSCIQYLAQLDGVHVVTVEGLKHEDRLNPVQEALVAEHGLQCGYCTPGFVVAMQALFDESPTPSRGEACRALVGNLCRCTGYDAILNSVGRVDRAGWKTVAELYPDPELQPILERAARESVEITDGPRRMFKPATLDEAVRWRAATPNATVLAGGTDLGVVWNKGRREVGSLLCLGVVAELQESSIDAGIWSIGAATTLADIERSARDVLPNYGALLERFGSPPIRHAGTLGGNLANGSPIGDTMPALFVLDAEVELVGPNGRRRVNVNQFYTGYRSSVMQPDELIARVHVPLPGTDELFGVYKISKRRDLDISTMTAAVWMHVEGDIIRAARIAYGGVAPTIVRLTKTEAWLSEQRLTESTLRQAGRLARTEIAPISDVRGSAEYRGQLAENILVKFGRDHSGAAIPTNGQPA